MTRTRTKLFAVLAFFLALALGGLRLWYRDGPRPLSLPDSRTVLAQEADAGDTTKPVRPGKPKPRDRLLTLGKDEEPYELTTESPVHVAVNLRGGPATRWAMFGAEPEPPPMDRTVRGRVVDGAGQPIAGAHVVVSSSLTAVFNHFFGVRGATSATDGTFALTIPSKKAFGIIAVQRSFGWSSPVPLPAGSDERHVELRIDKHGSLQGTITRAGKAIEAGAILHSAQRPQLGLSADADHDGVYRFSVVPAGQYMLRVSLGYGDHHRGAPSMGSATAVKRSVTVEPGQTLTEDIELPVGAIVVVHVAWPAQEPATASYQLIPGTGAIMNAAQLRARMQQVGRDEIQGILYGGVDTKNLMHFYDVAPNAYTVCVQLKIADESNERLRCEAVTIAENDDTKEVTVSFD